MTLILTQLPHRCLLQGIFVFFFCVGDLFECKDRASHWRDLRPHQQDWNSVVFTYFWFLVLQNYCCCENWGQMKEMEGNWGFLAYAFRIKNSELSSPKILSFEFLCLCLWESLVNSDGSEYLVLYLDHMNESLDFYLGWICVVFAICFFFLRNQTQSLGIY